MNQSTTPLDRALPPELGPSREFRFPPFERRRLGALEILLLPRHELPIFEATLLCPSAGADHQGTDAPGLASFTAACLMEGTEEHSAVEFGRASERLGGYVSSGASWDSTAVSGGALAPHFEEILELMAAAYLRPSFAEADVARVRSRRLSELARRRADPSARASMRLLREIYDGDLYGTPLLGTPESLERLDPQSVQKAWSSRHLETACLVVAGDVEVDRAVAACEQHLGPLLDKSETASEDVSPTYEGPRVPSTRVRIVDRPDAAQTQWIVGHDGPGRLHPERPTLRLLNGILGGKFSSRINLNLRERNGYTYGASSSFGARRHAGPFVINAALETESVAAATRETLREIERIRDDLVEPEELDETRRYLQGVQPYTFQSLSGWSSALSILGVLGLPDDWLDEQHRALERVDREQIRKVARECLHPERLAIIAVGPGDELAEQFGGFVDVVVESASS